MNKLVDVLKLAAGAIQDELEAAGPEEVAQHPILRGHAQVLAKCRAVLENLPPQNLQHCQIHFDTLLTCQRCIGAKGGKSRSKAKLAAVRKNALLGGRPPKRKRSV